MTALAESPPVAQEPAPPPVNKFVQYVTTPPQRQPSRMMLIGAEGLGKTSFAAQAKDVIFLMTRGEDGLKTLINSGRLNQTAHFPDIAQTWKQVLENIGHLQTQPHPFKTLAIDCINGVERLLHETICTEHFSDNWGEQGFSGFDRGPRLAVSYITTLLQKLDNLRTSKGMSIILLSHASVATFKNPEGPDYDRLTASLHKSTWQELHRWCDIVLFLRQLQPTVSTASKRATKVKANSSGVLLPRVICTERTALHDGKNRHGLPPIIDCGNSAAEAWKNFTDALKGARE